ncbi:DUF2141 domain-containing protein [Lacimicrobium alkaliphilum]|uniref:DUF2141 domain-containing protein n=1 Tax=Lacimicrobium alkaliphilum TaxID=1526571 RepID=A0ABQ1RK34_9ALTE|nr:DUF2141 domain-containing protein [Lacimicrobium alkaliphilum]GGD73235.1 hypothetical protein GCM10011357_30370 [Lacimicrobium alkaliphilum]
MRTFKTLVLISALQMCSAVYAGNINVNIDNLIANEGKIYASLCQQNNFMNGRCHFEIVRKVQHSQQKLTFNDVGDGTYAISVFYDKNDNGELDTSLFGIPKEPTGVSNNVAAKNGPPQFQEASFEVTAGESVQIQISVF